MIDRASSTLFMSGVFIDYNLLFDSLTKVHDHLIGSCQKFDCATKPETASVSFEHHLGLRRRRRGLFPGSDIRDARRRRHLLLPPGDARDGRNGGARPDASRRKFGAGFAFRG